MCNPCESEHPVGFCQSGEIPEQPADFPCAKARLNFAGNKVFKALPKELRVDQVDHVGHRAPFLVFLALFREGVPLVAVAELRVVQYPER